MTETVTSLDETKVLGYFETLKSLFLLKILLLLNHLSPGSKTLDPASFHSDSIRELENSYKDHTFNALRARSDTLVPNLLDDIGSSALIGAWIVFELVIKDRTKKDYSLHADDLSADYRKKIFGLTDREKKDLDLFYYIRNAIVHYNGAYYKDKEISHTFAGRKFSSVGNEGKKIESGLEVVWQVVLRIEELALKAWTASQVPRGKGKS